MSTKRPHSIIRACAFGILWLYCGLMVGCGQETSSPRSETDTGALSVQILWPELPENAADDQSYRALGEHCEAYGVAEVVLAVYYADWRIFRWRSFDCALGTGEISDIPPGEDWILEVSANSTEGVTRYYAYSEDIRVTAGDTHRIELPLEDYPIDEGEFRISNDTYATIEEVYISDCDADVWGENVAPSGGISGYTTGSMWYPPGCYDVCICDEYDVEKPSDCSVEYGYQLEANGTVHISYYY